MALVPAAERLRIEQIFGDAAIPNQVLMATLALAALTALVCWALGRVRAGGAEPSRAVGGLRYLKGLWLGSVLLGLTGASFTLLSMCVALANVRPSPPIGILAPGFAEALFQVMLGLAVAAIAVICQQDLDSRLRRVATSA